jgi:hypothetical protein
MQQLLHETRTRLSSRTELIFGDQVTWPMQMQSLRDAETQIIWVGAADIADVMEAPLAFGVGEARHAVGAHALWFVADWVSPRSFSGPLQRPADAF